MYKAGAAGAEGTQQTGEAPGSDESQKEKDDVVEAEFEDADQEKKDS